MVQEAAHIVSECRRLKTQNDELIITVNELQRATPRTNSEKRPREDDDVLTLELRTAKNQISTQQSKINELVSINKQLVARINSAESASAQQGTSNTSPASIVTIEMIENLLKNFQVQITAQINEAIQKQTVSKPSPTIAAPAPPTGSQQSTTIESSAENVTNALKKRNRATTFASILANSTIPVENKFSLLVDTGDDERDNLILSDISTTSEFRSCGFVKNIEKRSSKCLAVTAESTDVANCIKNKIAEKYMDQVIINTATKKKEFHAKITGCEPDERLSDEQFLTLLKESNISLANSEVSIIRSYVIDSARPYKNYIVSLTEAAHTELCKNGKVFLNLTSKNIYEYVDLLQCKRCWRYGHLHHGCKFKATCRKCGGDHPVTECAEELHKCANCIRYNTEKKAALKTSHRVTADRCPCRVNRIESLKEYYAKNDN